MKLKHAVLILLIIFFYFLWSYFILKKDEIPQLYDAYVCYSLSARFYKKLFENFKNIFSNINFYPPLYMLLPLPFFKIFGMCQNTLSLTNIVYFSILLFSLYKINEALNSSGLLSVIVILTFPVIIGYYRVTHLVIAITAILCLWIYFLFKTDNFKNKKYSLLSGIILGLGMLEGFHFACYIVGPLAIYVIISFLSREDTKNKIKNFLFFTLLSLLITCTWYVPAFFIGNFKDIFLVQFKAHHNLSGYHTYSRFLTNFSFINRLILLPNTIIFLVFLIYFLFKKNKKQKLLVIVASWFFISLFILSLFRLPPLTRYLLPILPSINIIIAFAFRDFFENFRKTTILLFCIFWSLFLFFSFNFQYKIPQDSNELLFSRLDYGILQSYKCDPKSLGLIEFLREKEDSHKFSMVIITEDSLNPSAFSLELLRNKLMFSGLNMEYHTTMSLCLDWPSYNKDKLILETFNKAKYILYVKDKRRIDTTRPEYAPDVNERLKYLLASCDKELLRIFKDPNNFFVDEFYLYEKKNL